MRLGRRLAVLASLSSCILFCACVLTTDFDGYVSPAPPGLPDGGSDARTGDGEAGLPDGTVPLGSDARVTTYGDVVRADNPLGYFPLDDAAGADRTFEAITKREGRLEGTVTFGLPGVSGTAAKVEQNGSIDFGDILDIKGESAFTLEAWVFPTLNDGVFYEFFNKREGDGNGYVAYVRREDGQPVRAQLEVGYAGGGRGSWVELPKLDHFIHVLWTFEPGVGIRAWADGVPGEYGYNDPGGPTASAQVFRLLGSFRGVIDELAVYDHALSPERIFAHYAAGTKK